MKKFLTVFFSLLLVLFSTRGFAQHPVIFETFGVCDDLCPLPVSFYGDDTTVAHDKRSEIIHLDYHNAFSDPLVDFSEQAPSISAQLFPSSGNPNVFFGSVDRIDMGTAKAESQQNNSSWVGDMESAIDAEHAITPPDMITFDSATVDPSTQLYTLKAYLTITANGTISNDVKAHYAIVEDGVSLSTAFINNKTSPPIFCTGSPTTYNDLVRWITVKDSAVFTSGTPSGTSVHLTYVQPHLIGTFRPDTMILKHARLIVFLTSGTDGSVIDAKVLLSDLSSLPAPQPTLSINSSNLDGKTFNPGGTMVINYTGSNLPNGADLYFSNNGGTTWTLEEGGQFNPIDWSAPDSITTQGKIQLVGTGFPSLVSTETGTFSIIKAATLQFDSPLAGAVFNADSLVNFTWSQSGITSDTLEYSLRDHSGGYPKFTPITVTSDTSFLNWKLPDTTDAITFQLVPVNAEAPAIHIIDTIKQLTPVDNGLVEPTSVPALLSIQDIYPNPASNGQDMTVEYSELSARPVSVVMLDLLGHEVPAPYSLRSGTVQLSTNSLSSGAYILRLSDGVNTVSKQVEIVK